MGRKSIGRDAIAAGRNNAHSLLEAWDLEIARAIGQRRGHAIAALSETSTGTSSSQPARQPNKQQKAYKREATGVRD